MSSAKYSNSMLDARPKRATPPGPHRIWSLAKSSLHFYKPLISPLRAAQPQVAVVGGPPPNLKCRWPAKCPKGPWDLTTSSRRLMLLASRGRDALQRFTHSFANIPESPCHLHVGFFPSGWPGATVLTFTRPAFNLPVRGAVPLQFASSPRSPAPAATDARLDLEGLSRTRCRVVDDAAFLVLPNIQTAHSSGLRPLAT